MEAISTPVARWAARFTSAEFTSATSPGHPLPPVACGSRQCISKAPLRYKFRWVDDRYTVVQSPRRVVLDASLAIEVLTYTSVTWQGKMAIAALVGRCCHEAHTDVIASLVLRIASWLVPMLGQTVEEPCEFVGLDVSVWSMPRSDGPVHPAFRLHADGCGDIHVPACSRARFVTRMTTKDPSLLPGSPRSACLLSRPRLQDSDVDIRDARCRISGLVQWLVRIADSITPDVCDTELTDDEAIQDGPTQWMMASLDGFLREASLCGWRWSEITAGAARAWSGAMQQPKARSLPRRRALRMMSQWMRHRKAQFVDGTI